MQKTSFSRKVFVFLNTVFLSALAIVCLYPLLYVLFASLSDSNKLMAHTGFLLWPIDLNFAAFGSVFQNPMILSGYINTIIIVVLGTLINLVMTSLGAYFFSRKNVMLKKPLMMLVTFTMFFSGGMVPSYLVVQMLGIYDTIWAIVLPGAISTYNMIVLRTNFEGIPDSLEEAATIDGAGHFRILLNIVLPLSKAAMAVMVLWYGVGHWNAWFNAMIYLQDRSKFPLQLILREILIQNDTASMTQGAGTVDGISVAESVKYAVIVVATVPILAIYPFLQKYFVKGVMIGAVKG